MLAARRTASDTDLRDGEGAARAHVALFAQPVQADAGARDVDDGIDRPDLVEVHLVRRRPMDGSLGLGETREHLFAPGERWCGEIAAAENLEHVFEVPVRMGCALIENDAHLRRCDAMTRHRGLLEPVALEGQARQDGADVRERNAEIDERAQRHVTGDAGGTIEDQGLHEASRPRRYIAAAAAAPKPLSMLTTVTPTAQLFNMPSSAARPPKLAP